MIHISNSTELFCFVLSFIFWQHLWSCQDWVIDLFCLWTFLHTGNMSGMVLAYFALFSLTWFYLLSMYVIMSVSGRVLTCLVLHFLLEFYVLIPSVVMSGWILTCFACWFIDVLCTESVYADIRTGTDLWQRALIVTLWCCLTGRLGNHRHHDLIPHSVILSWCRPNQSLPYPSDAERQARNWQVSIM